MSMVSSTLRTLDVRPRSTFAEANQLVPTSTPLTEHGQERGLLLTVRPNGLHHAPLIDEDVRRARDRLAHSGVPETTPPFAGTPAAFVASVPDVRWIGAVGEEQTVAGECFRLSFCYAGAGSDDPTNPTLIDPAHELGPSSCEIGRRRQEFAGYGSFSPAERRHYLEWNSGGRRAADVPRAFLLLFVSTLEHAIVRDGRRDFLPEARAELVRLTDLHRTDPILCSRAERLITACRFLDPTFQPAIIDPRIDPNFRAEMPFDVRHYLGWMLKTYDRLEADGGLLFYLQQPGTHIEPTVWQYFRELRAMWCLQFPYAGAAEFARSSELPRLRLAYEPLFGDFARVWGSDLPDVAAFALSPKLQELYDACAGSIAQLRHQPVGGIVANMPVIDTAPLLPREKFDPKPGAAARLAALVPGAEPRPIDVAQLLPALVDSGPLKPNKLLATKRTEMVTHLLDEQGFGFEPDLRFGSPNCLRPDHRVVLFRTEKLPHQGPSEAYLLAQAAVVLSAWGQIWLPRLEPLRLDCLEQRLPYRHRFSDREYRRLEATRLAVASQVNPRKFIERWVHHLFRDKRESDLIGAFTVAYRSQRRNLTLARLARFISMNCTTPIDYQEFLDATADTKPSEEAYHIGLGDRVRALQETSCLVPDTMVTIAEARLPATPVPTVVLEGLGVTDAELLLALRDRARSRAEFAELARNRRVSVSGSVERINEWGFIHLGSAAVAEGENFAISLEARDYLDRRASQG